MIDANAVAQISAKLDFLSSRIKVACERAGRNPAEVEIMAVTKYAAPLQIQALVETGRVAVLGESRVLPAIEKWQLPELSAIRSRVKLHLIGRVQSNKAGRISDFFDGVDSIDNIASARIIGAKAAALGRKMPVLIQVKLTDRETQSGVPITEAAKLAEQAAGVEGLSVRGYMAIAPIVQDQQELRPYFRRMKQLFDTDFSRSAPGVKNYLSLGMTGDFEAAVEEGSNLPRIGSAIFAK